MEIIGTKRNFRFRGKSIHLFSSFVSCRACGIPIFFLMNDFYITIHHIHFILFVTILHTNIFYNKLFTIITNILYYTTNYSPYKHFIQQIIHLTSCGHFNLHLHFFRGVIIIRTQHAIPVVNVTTTNKTWQTVSRRVGDSVKFRISISPNRINFRSWWRHIWFLIETTFLNVNFEFYICPEYVLIDEHAVRFEL